MQLKVRARRLLITPLSVMLFLLLAFAAQAEQAKSVILMIGDGMGPLQVKLASLAAGRSLVMETLPVHGSLSTRSADDPITDSAAAATALATGYKTNNGMIAMTPDGKAKRTVLEAARDAGKATGTVTTTNPGHATPASFVAHVSSRASIEEIVVQALDANQEVVMGGGKSYFLPTSKGGSRKDGVDLLEKAKNDGYQVVDDTAELAAVKDGKVLGLFGTGTAMSFDIDREPAKEPSLAEMTSKALELVSKDPDGFFLMVEGGKIDTGGHDNDPGANFTDTLAFDAAVQVALDYAKAHPEVLLVVTADHETGGLTLGNNVNVEPLRAVKRSATYTATAIRANRSDAVRLVSESVGVNDLTSAESAGVRTITNATTLKQMVGKLVANRANVSYKTTGHSATPVPVYAYGVQSGLFTGTDYPNTDIAKRLAAVMGLELQ